MGTQPSDDIFSLLTVFFFNGIYALFVSGLALIAGVLLISSIKQVIRAKRNQLSGDKFMGGLWAVVFLSSSIPTFLASLVLSGSGFSQFLSAMADNPITTSLKLIVAACLAYFSARQVQRAFRHEYKYDTRLGILWSIIFAVSASLVVINLYR